MSLLARLRLIEPFETWAGLERTAEERFWDAYTLALEERRTASIYLAGYVVEVLLKVAIYRVYGLPPGLDLERPLTPGKRDTPRRMLRQKFRWAGGSWHNLRSLFTLLMDIRTHRRLPPSGALGALHGALVQIEGDWDVTLRYKATPATEEELTRVIRALEGFYAGRGALWS